MGCVRASALGCVRLHNARAANVYVCPLAPPPLSLSPPVPWLCSHADAFEFA